MSKHEKQFKRLDILEREFRQQLAKSAVSAADNSHSQLFLSAEFNPWPELEGKTDPTTDQLIQEAHQIIKLRRQLANDEHCLAATFLDYCRRFVDLGNHNRLGVRKHAKALLNEIQVETKIVGFEDHVLK